MRFTALCKRLPSWISIGLSVLSAILLSLSFPDVELWFLAFIALIPLFIAVDREKESFVRSFLNGWLFGTVFFTGTCWWLTYAPIHYGGVPASITYILLLGATGTVGLFPGIFAGFLSISLKRLGAWGIFAAPFLWIAVEYLRFWLTGNNWNAIAYSQAFSETAGYARIGGIYLTGFVVLILQAISFFLLNIKAPKTRFVFSTAWLSLFVCGFFLPGLFAPKESPAMNTSSRVVAIQGNVPMDGIEYYELEQLKNRHVELSEKAYARARKEHYAEADERVRKDAAKEGKVPIDIPSGIDNDGFDKQPKVIIFPESPMNFMYSNDRAFQAFIGNFARRNNASVLFNSAEPTADGKGYYNSAVMINEQGKEIAQYDKMHLVPFAEFVPLPEPIAQYVPSMVGRFSKGTEYDLLTFGDAKAGVMICFESHFPTLSREFARNGADVLVEMTNDGYLGPTPVLRQHLANAVFRAVETGRPVLRVTNVGITAYIDEAGRVHEPSQPYTEDARVWTVSKSDGLQTFYVKYGDWFAWVCVSISAAFLVFSFWRKRAENA